MTIPDKLMMTTETAAQAELSELALIGVWYHHYSSCWVAPPPRVGYPVNAYIFWLSSMCRGVHIE